ncbi:chemotaxis protein CheC [Pelotomaculum terephthalicicum JT]|uniref:chemotaxis protein CheC n=1 Tax=Pelotomaculum TaxID=191373 RepID=UPI0009C8E381|nr:MULTISPECIES: chemotaxis protein CheC [Pelotomaculum]MCG9967957.1 chemotaxis protein CheC [Pelotomaculum terephthalicicum JT]OPX88557.1 MAG: CheY-P phosphatase CheC [Pelotomaculum sp. PtaB.Bin117]OPY63070.1 MAG: CheY-P phosphatase CheC [Pelotomaculum sp. PtaU1.Bin065]
MIKKKVIPDVYIDALQEISNIGLGNAATALAELLDKKVDMAVPKAFFFDVEEIFDMVGGPEEIVSCVFLNLEGDIHGTVLFIFTERSTYRLIEMLTGQEVGNVTELDVMGESAVSEIGNVLTGSFMNAIGGMTGLRMNTSVPMFAFDMFGAILSTSLVASGHWDDQVLFIETVFFQETDEIRGHFFMLPETGALNRLFEALGVTEGV